MPERELDAALDDLIARFGQGAHADEVVRARAVHADRTGRVFEEDKELYEMRTVAFLEWYVTEYVLSSGATPVATALAEPGLDEERRTALRAWAGSHRSVFVIEDLGEGEVVLRDLVGGAWFSVDERRRLPGVAPNDVLEARLLGWRERVRFGRTFCFHPAGARGAIEGHVGRIVGAGGTRADAVDFVGALRVKVERYRHVAPERVYEAET
jgi:hypothetical protein